MAVETNKNLKSNKLLESPFAISSPRDKQLSEIKSPHSKIRKTVPYSRVVHISMKYDSHDRYRKSRHSNRSRPDDEDLFDSDRINKYGNYVNKSPSHRDVKEIIEQQKSYHRKECKKRQKKQKKTNRDARRKNSSKHRERYRRESSKTTLVYKKTIDPLGIENETVIDIDPSPQFLYHEEVVVKDSSKCSNSPVDGDGDLSLNKENAESIYKSDEESLQRIITDSDFEDNNTLPPYYPAIEGCRSVEEFEYMNRIEEGSYGVVFRAREKRTGKIMALKRLKMENEKEGFPITSLREINMLMKAQHPNIVTVQEIAVGSNMDKIYIVMEYVDRDLKMLMDTMKKTNKVFTTEEIKSMLLQLLRAVCHLHDNSILHRDLKMSNILYSDAGVLKVGDFGSSREYGSPLKPYTSVMVTLWYRAPELLLGAKEYSTNIDMWSVGCIFGEFLRMQPLFPGKSESNQLRLIFETLGTPTAQNWPEYPTFPLVKTVVLPQFAAKNIRSEFESISELGSDLLSKFLKYNTKTRITADEALNHEWFNERSDIIAEQWKRASCTEMGGWNDVSKSTFSLKF